MEHQWEENMKQVTAVLIGAGLRGADAYASYALKYPNELKIIAVAEPNRERRERLAGLHGISTDYCYENYESLLAKEKMADCALICTQDRMHYEPVMTALEKGYHVMVEKPMSPEREEIMEMGRAAKKYDRILSVCHVLRYSPFFVKLKELLEQGRIGELVSIQHIESVGYWHQAHSFVRGNWSDGRTASPMILQKCCHDMDILLWLSDSHCTRISSFGNLKYFKKENAPEDAPKYCLDGCRHRDTCPYFAPRFYLEHPSRGDLYRAVSLDTGRESLLRALEKGPYGRCVFQCGNDVVDHQVVNIEFENQVTASFTMCAFTDKCERVINLMGTEGQIRGNMESGEIEIMDFASGDYEKIVLHKTEGGHSGSDEAMMKDFTALIAGLGNEESTSTASMAVESHLMALAAEESRITGKVVCL